MAEPMQEIAGIVAAAIYTASQTIPRAEADRRGAVLAGEIIAALELAAGEVTSQRVAHIAAIGLRDPGALTDEQIRTVCASALTQRPDKAD